MGIKNRLKLFVDSFSKEEDGEVVAKAEKITKEFHKEQAQYKLEQLKEVNIAMSESNDPKTKKLLSNLASTLEEQIQESELKVQMREDYLQSIVDVQIGRRI